MTRQSTEELQKQLKKLEIANNHRNDHLEFMSRMFSHNLRSPVSGLKMLFRLLDMVDEEEREDVLENIKSGSEELFSMIDDLALVFLDYRMLVHDVEKIDFQEVLTGVKSDLDAVLRETGGIIKSDFHVKQVYYHLDHLRIIFTELMTNSIKFCPKDRKPRIEITSYLEDDKLMLSIGDNACGIDLDRHEKDIFKMYKPIAEQESGASKGIGLFRVKNLVEMNGGKIDILSTSGAGTKFVMELCRV